MYLMNRPWSPPSAGQDRGTAWHPARHPWARGGDGRSPPSPHCRNAVMSRAVPEPPGGPVVSAQWSPTQLPHSALKGFLLPGHWMSQT